MRKLRSSKSALHEGYVLVVTTNDKERRAVLNCLAQYRKLECEYSGCRAFMGSLDGRLVVVLDGVGGFASKNAATGFAIQYLSDTRHPKPAFVALCGVCWGNPAKVNVGDVLVGTTVISLNRTTARGGVIETMPQYFASSLQLPEVVPHLYARASLKLNSTLLTLEQLIEDPILRDSYIAMHPTANGGEMESFALVPFCSRFNIPWVVVKGVSDFATAGFERDGQQQTAELAARVLADLIIAEIPDPTALNDPTSMQRVEIIHELHGNEIELNLVDLDQNNLKISVQNHFTRIHLGIAFHTGAGAINEELPASLARTVLELALNAFSHGKATKARLRLEIDKISYSDDGLLFDIQALETAPEPRGGAFTWEHLKRHHITYSHVQVHSQEPKKRWRNRYYFELLGASSHVFDARINCKAGLNFSLRPSASPQQFITYHEACDLIYIDLSPIEMISVVFDVCEQFRSILDAGKQLIVFTPNTYLARRIQSVYMADIDKGLIVLLPTTEKHPKE